MGAWGRGAGKGLQGARGNFRGDENDLFHCGGYTGVHIWQNSANCTLKMGGL